MCSVFSCWALNMCSTSSFQDLKPFQSPTRTYASHIEIPTQIYVKSIESPTNIWKQTGWIWQVSQKIAKGFQDIFCGLTFFGITNGMSWGGRGLDQIQKLYCIFTILYIEISITHYTAHQISHIQIKYHTTYIRLLYVLAHSQGGFQVGRVLRSVSKVVESNHLVITSVPRVVRSVTCRQQMFTGHSGFALTDRLIWTDFVGGKFRQSALFLVRATEKIKTVLEPRLIG